MSVRNRMKTDLRQAMKERDMATVATLRTMLAALDNAEAVPVEVNASFQWMPGQHSDVPRKALSEEEFLQILRKEAVGRRTAIATYEGLGRIEEAERLRAELSVFERYIGPTDV